MPRGSPELVVNFRSKILSTRLAAPGSPRMIRGNIIKMNFVWFAFEKIPRISLNCKPNKTASYAGNCNLFQSQFELEWSEITINNKKIILCTFSQTKTKIKQITKGSAQLIARSSFLKFSFFYYNMKLLYSLLLYLFQTLTYRVSLGREKSGWRKHWWGPGRLLWWNLEMTTQL